MIKMNVFNLNKQTLDTIQHYNGTIMDLKQIEINLKTTCNKREKAINFEKNQISLSKVTGKPHVIIHG